jgi:hypothetical protein
VRLVVSPFVACRQEAPIWRLSKNRSRSRNAESRPGFAFFCRYAHIMVVSAGSGEVASVKAKPLCRSLYACIGHNMLAMTVFVCNYDDTSALFDGLVRIKILSDETGEPGPG